MKLLSSVLLANGMPRVAVFASFTAIAVVATVLMAITPRCDDDHEDDAAYDAAVAAAAAEGGGDRGDGDGGDGGDGGGVLALLRDDPCCALLLPFNVAFGFAQSFDTSYVNGVVVADTLGEASIGYLTAVLVGAATLCAAPFARLAARAPRRGGTLVVALGGAAWCAFCVAFALAARRPAAAAAARSLRPWPALAALYALFGVGRAAWEGQFKATFADFFPHAPQAAFANVILQSGLASAVGFFAFPRLPPTLVGLLCAATSAVGVAGYCAAQALHASEVRRHRRSSEYAPLPECPTASPGLRDEVTKSFFPQRSALGHQWAAVVYVNNNGVRWVS